MGTIPKVYDLKKPGAASVPLVVDSPHSGSLLPEDFHFICSLQDIRQSEDSYMDRFAAGAPRHGAAVLRALTSRAYIDLNRAVSDLHPDVCAEDIPWPIHRSKRVQYGMGLIRHLVRPKENMYAAPLPLAAIEHRIKHYYEPYYAALESELKAAHQSFGRVLHVNLHAMPAIGADGAPLEDVILGDHDGHSCARMYREAVKKVFESHGLKVVVNHPYKGVELTKRFAKPRQGFHSIQIEVNKSLYMDEQTLALHDGFHEMQKVFDDLWKNLATLLAPQESEMPKAAE